VRVLLLQLRCCCGIPHTSKWLQWLRQNVSRASSNFSSIRMSACVRVGPTAALRCAE
jgi:hypothetical protein